jgi:hypothetical protein
MLCSGRKHWTMLSALLHLMSACFWLTTFIVLLCEYSHSMRSAILIAFVLNRNEKNNLKNTPRKEDHVTPSPSRIVKIIAFTVIGVIGAVALFSVLANFHGGIPFSQQAHLRMFGIGIPSAAVAPAVSTHKIRDEDSRVAKSDPVVAVAPAVSMHKIRDGDSKVAKSDAVVDLINEEGIYFPHARNMIRAAVKFNDLSPERRDFIVKHKSSVKKVQSPLYPLVGISESPTWVESTQWCIKVTPTKGKETRYGNLLWGLSSVTGASMIGLRPRKEGQPERKELPADLALKIAAQFPEGFLLPVESVRVGSTREVFYAAEWKVSLDSKVCPNANIPVAKAEYEQSIAKYEYDTQNTLLAKQEKETKDELEKAAAQVKAKLLQRAKYVQSAVAASTEIKLAASRYFASKAKWPVNNAETGLWPPEWFRDPEPERRVEIMSIAIEPYAQRSLVHLKFRDENNVVQSLFFRALTDSTSPEAWDCVSFSMKDIAEFVPTCKYLVK